ncbi:MAG TPA: ribbon-helix-helix protein, CopG family [Firmicutes bacterium]|jgi:CopG family transcriptional regulator/antitoxin EndoAI|nr:ribbon-helix-helix protein, CopG family [Bacillota bacterium]HOQ24223.1 ribbon-helix-helix domain-containing protein [Bacillota bacterium]HPT67617.1 ribbon-helix-helix domain-containing protein [Bacillota bacterium]
MPHNRRVAVNLPENLLSRVDRIVRREKGSRSAFIREAMLKLVAERERERRVEQLRRGYQQMGPLNLALAEEGLCEDAKELVEYEAMLAGEK